jgi:hypothetical protein
MRIRNPAHYSQKLAIPAVAANTGTW